MRTAEESRQRWDTLFDQHQCASLEELGQKLKSKLHGDPCEDGLRSICWKAFLVHKNVDRESWPTQLSDTRGAYTALKDHFLKYIDHPDDLPSAADPLAEDDNSPWQSLRQDEAIRTEIYQDVERCLQENYFFREPTTKRRMLDILFIFVKLNPDLGYRQGMHELLAPVLWAVWQDAIEKDSVSEDNLPSEDRELLLQALDSDYIEHDAFAIFCAIMQTAKLFYEHDEMKSNSDQQNVSSIIARSQRIHQILLGSIDPELMSHLQTIGILPQIYLTRWLRLFFGREFPFENTLSMWDLMFTDLRPELVELVCVSMLIRIRWQLLSCDYSSALALLLRYPSPEPHKPEVFVLDALFLEENMTWDGASLLISKYTGKSPDLQGRNLRYQTVPTASQKKNSYSRDPSSRASEDNSPSRSPLRINQKRLDSLFQDVSDGISRRTEAWGVARAVRGAMIEARRNIQGIHSGPATPGLPFEEGPISKLSIPSKVEAAAPHELSLKVASLKNRNKTLANLLGDALKDLRAYNGKLDDVSRDQSTRDVDEIIRRIERVQKLLQDSSLPIIEKRRKSSTKVNSSTVSKASHAETHGEALAEKSEQLETDSGSTSTPPTPLNSKESKPLNLIKPMPIRPVPRTSLAESSFSWMLGEDDRRSAFAPCASVPPEHLRRHELQSKPGPLFRDQRSDDKRKRAKEAESDGLVLDPLQGKSEE
ncbi:hypothetical protein DIZ76_017685 [Coccidioides immitis]|nr:hypothetical protein DIZ76_017685 [Coccidioides immitis]